MRALDPSRFAHRHVVIVRRSHLWRRWSLVMHHDVWVDAGGSELGVCGCSKELSAGVLVPQNKI